MATPEEAGEWLVRETREGDVVLLKASRGVKLERALEAVVGRQSSVVSKSKTADALTFLTTEDRRLTTETEADCSTGCCT